jgi:ethanolamine-phosphate phospho-lyase
MDVSSKEFWLTFAAGAAAATGAMLLARQETSIAPPSSTKERDGNVLVQAVTGGPHLTKAQIVQMRADVSCKAQSVSYANTSPLLAMAGSGQYLYDETGKKYLDTRNNVGHVGHANAVVAEAVSKQVRTFNSNTRYLHPNHVQLATRLRATFPGKLGKGKVFFVNSGSEANDLALRLARVHTNCKETIVVSHAYHGHTCEVIAISPYKYKYGAPGDLAPAGQMSWVTEVAAPDTYRGVRLLFVVSGMWVARCSWGA